MAASIARTCQHTGVALSSKCTWHCLFGTFIHTHTHTRICNTIMSRCSLFFPCSPRAPQCKIPVPAPRSQCSPNSEFKIRKKDKFQTAEVLFQFYGYLRCRRIVNLRVLYSGKLGKARLSASQILRGPSWRMTDHGHMQAFEKPSLVLRCRNGNVRSSIAKESLVSLLVVE